MNIVVRIMNESCEKGESQIQVHNLEQNLDADEDRKMIRIEVCVSKEKDPTNQLDKCLYDAICTMRISICKTELEEGDFIAPVLNRF